MKLNFQRDIILNCIAAWVNDDQVYCVYELSPHGFLAKFHNGTEYVEICMGLFFFLNEATLACEDHFEANIFPHPETL